MVTTKFNITTPNRTKKIPFGEMAIGAFCTLNTHDYDVIFQKISSRQLLKLGSGLKLTYRKTNLVIPIKELSITYKL